MLQQLVMGARESHGNVALSWNRVARGLRALALCCVCWNLSPLSLLLLLPLLLLLKLLLGVMELLFPLMLQLSLFLLLPHLLFACCHIAYLDNEAPVAVADSKRRHWAAAEI